MEKSLLIHSGIILPFDQNVTKILNPGFVCVQGDLIAEVGAGMPTEGMINSVEKVIDATGKAVIPGLINAHTHLYQTFLRGLVDDKPLMQWWNAAMLPGGGSMREEDFYLAALLGFVENLKCGATSVLCHSYVQTSPSNMDGVAEAAWHSGVRARLARGFGDRNPYEISFQEPLDRVISETERLVRRWNQFSGGRVQVEFGPNIPWGCWSESLCKVYQLACDWDVGLHMHLSETREEVQMSKEETGKPPARWLADMGLLDERWQLVHGVWLEEEELDLIAGMGCTLIHCPISNMFLASGIPAIPEWRRRNIPIALATDGPGSNNSQDMLEVLKFTACLQKVSTHNAGILRPHEVLEMAFHGGARAMGLESKIGRLAKGALADIVLVDLDRPHIAPVHSPHSALVYNANGNDVSTVIVGGKILVHEKRLVNINEATLMTDCLRAAESLVTRSGLHSILNQ